MNQYKTLHIKLSSLQVNNLKTRIENGAEVTLNLPSNIVDDSKDGNDFPHKLLLTDTYVSRLPKNFVNDS